jgi:hypothetical protein
MSRFRDTVQIGFSKDGLSEADARMWDTVGSAIIRDAMARYFDNDPERACDAQYAAMSWKDWARDAIESGLEPPEKDALVREWIGFAGEIDKVREDLKQENLHLPDIDGIYFDFRFEPERADMDRER